ncbi:helix-turn-helix domain-containing protein [Halopseudomonas pachastrellae]|nr:helix-turn-helix domain-containing protein [Halopseudomonas pachastrellae]
MSSERLMQWQAWQKLVRWVALDRHCVRRVKREGCLLPRWRRSSRFPARRVERLEQGQYDSLPGDTFARGYIRSYARLMGMDPARLALAFDRERGIEVRERSVSSIARVEPPSRSGRTLMWWSSVLIIVALVLSALWWYETSQPTLEPLSGLEELIPRPCWMTLR